MKSPLAAPRGRQTPRVSHYPRPEVPRCYDAGLDALSIADVAGRNTLDWQAHVVTEGMATDPVTDAWIAFEVAVLVARQNGKNGGIEVVELGWLINEPGISVLHTAHEFSTALESMDKLESLIRSHPLLENEIRQIRRGNGREMIQVRNDCKLHPRRGETREKDSTEVCRCSTIRFRTRTKSGGRGFSVDRLVIDEAMIWSPASQAAIMPLLTTAERPQIWYLGSAADEEVHEHCGKWASLRDRALAGDDPSLLWMEWSAPNPPKDLLKRAAWRADVDNWAAANPSLDLLVSESYIANEMASFRADIEKWEIERLSVGRWPSTTTDNDPDLAKLRKWPDLVDLAPDLIKPYPATIAVDRNPLTKVWSIAGAQRKRNGHAHIEIGWSGTESATEVVERIVRIVSECNPLAIVIDERSPAAVLKPYLIEAGLEPVMTTTTQLANACQGIVEALDANQITNSGQDVLTQSVGATAKRDLPGGRYAWAPKSGGSIVHFQSATLAHWVLLEQGAPAGLPAPPLAASRDDSSGLDREFDALNAAF